jgi:prepilin-type N-terminal cleavage/methylation domain-containing protein
MKPTDKGFTLVELMIAAAIIGVLAAFAIPIYNNYIERAKVSDAVYLLAGFKHTTVEFYNDRQRWPPTVESVGGKEKGAYTSIIKMGGIHPLYWVEATLKGEVMEDRIYGRQMRLYYNVETQEWRCSLDNVDDDGDGGRPIPSHLTPSSCRD